MTVLLLQTRASALRARLEGREGSPQALSALASRWVDQVAAQASASNPNVREVQIASAQAVIALMELAGRLEFNLLDAVSNALTRKEMQVIPKEPTVKRNKKQGSTSGVYKYLKEK